MSNFDFLGFEPSIKLQEESQNRLKQLLKITGGVVDHDAYIVKTMAGFFEGSLKIDTVWDTFCVTAMRDSAESVLAEIYAKMSEKIATWRRMRDPILPSSRYWFERMNEESRSHHRRAS